jgi:hypothetical protein
MEDITADAVFTVRADFSSGGDVDFVVRVGFVRYFACTSNTSVYYTHWFIELVMRIDDTSLHTI